MNKVPKNLKDLSHFRTDPRVQFKIERVGSRDVCIPVYMIADADFWKQPYARELRGHTYDASTGELLGVALHKFFNVGENTETQPDQIDWDSLQFPQEKVDGSMITPVVIDDVVYFKTKKSFYSDVALDFTEWFWKQEYSEIWSKNIICMSHVKMFPIFEFFHPNWQIVCNYGEANIWLLNVRGEDGKYHGADWAEGLFRGMSRRDTEYGLTGKKILEIAKMIEGVEGWILYDPNKNEMYKVKTYDYLRKHRVKTCMRERDVAEMAANEMLDDVKSTVVAAGEDLSKIEQIEKSVAIDITSIRSQVEGVILEDTAKDTAAKFKGHPYFGMIMRRFNGKDIDYCDYFLKNILKEKYSLTNVYNKNF